MPEQTQQQGIPYIIPMHHTSSNILYMTEPSSELRRLELTFKNCFADENGKIIKYGEPLMNDYGISVILGMVRSAVTQITIMTFLTDRDINVIMLDFCDNLNKILMLKCKDFGLDRKNRPIVKLEAKNLAYFCMTRALEGGERGFWKGSVQEQRMVVDSGQENKKGGFLGKILGWNAK